MTANRKFIGIGLVLVLVLVCAVAAILVLQRKAGYTVQIAMPNALGVVAGTPVQVQGRDVGQVSSVRAEGNQAIVSASVDNEVGPLHGGTQATIETRSLLGERYVQLIPGPSTNPALPDGALIAAGSSQVVVEDLLEALDPATRSHLTSTIKQLDTALAPPNAQNLNKTFETAGPAIQALGGVLNAVGDDGAAIRTLLTNLQGVTKVLADRKSDLSSTVQGLDQVSGSVAGQQKQLSAGLQELPPTIDALQGVLDRFPAAADQLVPLLDDLKPAADRLPGVAANLAPVLQDLRPTLGLLRPTLSAADDLLGTTPGFIDQANALVPALRTTVERASPAVSSLRPFTPDVIGFAQNWGNLFSTYDSQGHFAHPLVVTGKTALDNNPPLTIPGENASPARMPGANAGQPWTDANGSQVR